MRANPKVDELYALRKRIRELQGVEQALSDQLKAYMSERNQFVLLGKRAYALLSIRDTERVPPLSLIERVGLQPALACLRVSVTQARLILPEHEVSAIAGEPLRVPVLRTEALPKEKLAVAAILRRGEGLVGSGESA